MFNAYRRLLDTGKQELKSWLRARAGYGLGGVLGANVAHGEASGPPRLNLCILGIDRAAMFGGSTTAVRFFEALRPAFERSRIVVVGQDEAGFKPSQWPGWTLEPDDPAGTRSILYVSRGRPISVEPSDVFIATHWRTAHYIQDLRRQLEARGARPGPYAYLIQDFEPGFHAFSGDYVLAEATYKDRGAIVPVFNTHLLADYFAQSGYVFDHARHVFEPSLNEVLARARPGAADHPRSRTLICYGRPSVARNAFALTVEALRVWSRLYPDAPRWTVLSLGEAHAPIALDRGLTLRAKGKATLDAYAQQLLESSVGLSLMISPHPSYPPLEMAEFGVRVVTNDFANKRASLISPNITGVDAVTPHALAQALIAACEAHEAPRDLSPVFQGGAVEFPFAAELAQTLKSGLQPAPAAKSRPARPRRVTVAS